jgi:hypothetical protein
MTNLQLTQALRAAAAERDPYDIAQRTPWRERVLSAWKAAGPRARRGWAYGPWMPHGMVQR